MSIKLRMKFSTLPFFFSPLEQGIFCKILGEKGQKLFPKKVQY